MCNKRKKRPSSPTTPLQSTKKLSHELQPTDSLQCSKVSYDERLYTCNYELGKLIGKGAYGKVHVAHDLQKPQKDGTYTKVAIKSMYEMEDERDLTLLLREIIFLRLLKHNNLLRLERLIVKDMSLWTGFQIVTPFCDMNLRGMIRSNQTTDVERRTHFINKIFYALNYLHSLNIMHRDMKPDNILIDANCDLKICDFGLARFVPDGRSLTLGVVTHWYRAPEVCRENDYNMKIDVWAGGCILAEMISGVALFYTTYDSNEKQLESIINVCQALPNGLPNDCHLRTKLLAATDSEITLLTRLLHMLPNKRLSSAETLTYLKAVDPSRDDEKEQTIKKLSNKMLFDQNESPSKSELIALINLEVDEVEKERWI